MGAGTTEDTANAVVTVCVLVSEYFPELEQHG
jgi:hypothetical protein